MGITELYEAGFAISEITSHLECDEESVQQHIDQRQLQQRIWTRHDDSLLREQWQLDVPAQDIGLQLDAPCSRSTVCVRASYLILARISSRLDGACLRSRKWTKT